MKGDFPKKGTLVIVWWRDASGSGAWSDSGDMEVVQNATVGWLTNKARDRIVLSATSGGPKWGQVTAIPLENVTECRLLRVGKRR